MLATDMGWLPPMPCPCTANSVCIDACTSNLASTFRQMSLMFQGLLLFSISVHMLPTPGLPAIPLKPRTSISTDNPIRMTQQCWPHFIRITC